MAIDQKNSQQQGLLQRTSIRTMKKDLQRLREADSLRENENIAKATTFPKKKAASSVNETLQSPSIADILKEEAPQQAPTIQPQDPSKVVHSEEFDMYHQGQGLPEEKEKKLETVLQETSKEELEAIQEAKGYATEHEKQQIFLLESRRAEFATQLEEITKKDEPPLLLERNNILLQQRKLKEKLTPHQEEERKIEAQHKGIESKEKETNVPSEKQHLEKERWKLEDSRQKSEKKRWGLEQELSQLEVKLKTLDESYSGIHQKQTTIRKEMREIDNSLRAVYAGITQRERQKRKEFVQKQQPSQQKDTQEKTYFNPIRGQKSSESLQMHQPSIKVKEVSPALKEKLKETTSKEEEQRRRFMEDVEKWAQQEEKTN